MFLSSTILRSENCVIAGESSNKSRLLYRPIILHSLAYTTANSGVLFQTFICQYIMCV